MKVNKLIEELKQYNPDADVSLTISEDILLSFIGDDPSSSLQVFIEPCDICEKCFFYDDSYCSEYDIECSLVDDCYQYLRDD